MSQANKKKFKGSALPSIKVFFIRSGVILFWTTVVGGSEIILLGMPTVSNSENIKNANDKILGPNYIAYKDQWWWVERKNEWVTIAILLFYSTG